MSTALTFDEPSALDTAPAPARWFATSVLAVAVSACLLAGWFPLGVSIVAVFLFAGPHNWMEGRYMLSRMPARWGPLAPFFITGIGGVLTLTVMFAALPAVARLLGWTDDAWLTAIAGWNTLLVLWIATLAWMRSRQNPRRDWAPLAPVALVLVALAWQWPLSWDLGLVYVHPLVALWFLDREIGKHRREWRTAYRCVLCVLPCLVALLWWRLADSPSLPGDDALSMRIAEHAGAGILNGVSSHLLVATHVFLEMLHYGVWLVMIPLVSLRTAPWRIDQLPLARRSQPWRRLVVLALGAGAIVVLCFWAGFLANYPATRDVYFTVALVHVLAEVPFLLRLL